jgi:hypothetical protein
MRWRCLVLVIATMLELLGGEAYAGNYVLYFHGRSMKGWPSYGLAYAPAGWQHITSTYNGSERINNSTVLSTTKSMLSTYCRGSNYCAILCYSAGCARVLYAFDQLKAAGTPATNVYWTEAFASAAGGTELCNYTSKWWKKFLAKVLGLYAKIDKDLTPSAMRSTYGFFQNDSPVAMYHRAGNRDICKKFLFGLIKICGNKSMPGSKGDGAVPFHSACGYSAAASRTACCDSGIAKYTNRQAGSCSTYGHDHAGMLAVGVVGATTRLGLTKSLSSTNFANNSSGRTDCGSTKDDCDTWMDTTEKTLPGVLNVTPADTDKDGKPDNCIDVDRNGCAHCYEFSIAETAYSSSCNIYTGTKTTSNYKTSFVPFNETSRPSSTTVRFMNYWDDGWGGYDGYNYNDMTLTNGVTVTRTTSGYSYDKNIDSIYIEGTNTIVIRYITADEFGSQYRYEKLTFSGATVVNGKQKWTGGTYAPGVRWEGNYIWFRYCGGYCDDEFGGNAQEKQFVILHPNDQGNDGS